jgi:hypothetical protein
MNFFSKMAPAEIEPVDCSDQARLEQVNVSCGELRGPRSLVKLQGAEHLTPTDLRHKTWYK